MGQKNFLDSFYDWMLRKGKKSKRRGIPNEPLAPSGARAKFYILQRILTDLGYLKAEKTKSYGYNYLVWPTKGCKRIYNIKPEEFIKWVDNKFPITSNRQEKQRKGAYVFAIWKFGEFLHYKMKNSNGKSLWTEAQLRFLKEQTHPPTIKKFELEIPPLEKIDPFLEFVKTKNLTLYTMAYLSRWLGGMRYEEVVNAPTDLNGRTLKIDFENDNVTIWGKGEGGLMKERYPTLLPQVKEVLKEYMKYREFVYQGLENDKEHLFLTSRSKRFSNNAGHFNKTMRKYAEEWGKFTKKELKLISSHKIGRHAFGTYFYPKMKEKLLMQEMGIEDSKTLHRYANITKQQRAAMMKEAVIKDNGNGEPHPRKESELSMIKELFSDLSKEDRIKLVTELIG